MATVQTHLHRQGMGKPREKSGLTLQRRWAGKAAWVGREFLPLLLQAHGGTSHNQEAERKQRQNHQKKKVGNKGKKRGRKWGVETSSSLSLAKVLALYVGGTQMSMSLGCCWAGGVPSREGGWRGWLGLSSPFASLTSRRSGVGCFQASWKERRGEQVSRCLGDKGTRGSNTGYQPSTLSERRRLRMAFSLELGKLCSVGGGGTSVRSWGSYTHTAWGRRRHVGLKASHSRAWQEPGQPCRSGTVPGCNVCRGSAIWQGQA